MSGISSSLESFSNTPIVRRLRFTAICLAAWTGVAVLFSIQKLVGFALKGTEPPWDRVALEVLVPWGGWALVTPLIALAVKRLPLTSDRPQRLLIHFPLGIGVGVLHSLIVASITPLFIWRPSFLPIRDMFAGRLATSISLEALIYLMVAAVLYAWSYASEALRQGEETQRLVLQLAEIRNKEGDSDSVTVPARDGLIRLPLRSIEWVHAEDNYVRLYVGNRSHLLRGTLADLERRLAGKNFVRVHRSAIVSVASVARVNRAGTKGYTVVLNSGAQLRVSRRHRRELEAAMQNRSPLPPVVSPQAS